MNINRRIFELQSDSFTSILRNPQISNVSIVLSMTAQYTPWPWLCCVVLAVAVSYIVCQNGSKNDISRETRQLLPAMTARTTNTLSYLFIAGVEGVGHHGISPAIATIAKTCGKHVLYEMNRLRADLQRKDARNIRLQLAMFRSLPYAVQDVVIIDDWSFPSAKTCRTCSSEQIKATPYYNLEWMHKELLSFMPSMSVKYLYLNRDFYRTVASHPEFEGTFERHAHVLYEYIKHLHSEYTIINKKQADVWRQISYEWFTNMDVYNCTAIVSAVIDFMQWDNCDVEYACHTLNETLHKERIKPIVPEEYAYVQAFNTTLSIPVLDITPNKTYAFTTKVSKRLPIVIVSDSIRKKRTSNVKKRSGLVAAPPSIVSSADISIQNNRVTLLYLVGLQGSDLSTVSTVLSIIAKSANQHVIHMHPVLSRAQRDLNAVDFKATLSMFKSFNFADTNEVLILFHKAFPLTEELPEPPVGDKFRSGAYNLLWVQTQAQELGFAVKFLYLQRDLAQTVMTLPSALLEQSIEQRALLLRNYTVHIQDEYQRIEDQKAGLWAQLRYEWFTQAQQVAGASGSTDGVSDPVKCGTLVAAIAQHAGWVAYKADRSCQHIRGMTFSTPFVSLTPEESRAIAAAQVNVTIPLLDLSVRPIKAVTGHASSSPLRVPALPGRKHKPQLPPKPKQAVARISTPPPNYVAAVSTKNKGRVEPPPAAVLDDKYLVPEPTNTVSMLYLVGLQGSDLETVAAALTSIAQAANYRVIAQHPQLVRAQETYEGAQYKATLLAFKYSKFEGTDKVLLLMHSALPVLSVGEKASSATAEDPINLLWVLTQAQEERVNLKVLYVQRDLPQLLVSLPPMLLLLPLSDRAHVLRDNMVLVLEEHQRMEDQQTGLWAQVRYDWFANVSTATSASAGALSDGADAAAGNGQARSCAALVNAVATHMGWEGCDKDTACVGVQAVSFLSPVLSLSAEEQEVVATVNVTLPVPYINIAPLPVESRQDEESSSPGVFQSSGRWHMRKRTAVVKGPVRNRV